MKRILVTRTDRLGDVILATPVLKLLREAYPSAQISFLVQKSWMPVLQYGSEIELIEYDFKMSGEELSEILRSKNFDRAYVLRDEAKVSMAVKKAGIPYRVGPFSSLRSFFLFNRGRFQKRSQCRMHEAEYNLDLVSARTPARKSAELPEAWVKVSSADEAKAQRFLSDHKLESKNFTVIHPGSSGSARYVKVEKLKALAKALIERNEKVVISGGPQEQAILDAFHLAVPRTILLGANQDLGLGGMAAVYAQSKTVVAHGTGPLHLAAAVGARVLAIFPPLFVLSEKRWGPLTTKRAVWVPEVSCPEKFRCRGEKCRYYDCMDLFENNRAMQLLESIPT